MKKNFHPLQFIILSTILFSACSTNKYLRTISSYLNASQAEAKSKFMSDSYHSFFQAKEGTGDDKATSLNDFKKWDGQLSPDVKIINHHFKGNTGIVSFNEQNDFSKLIGFPGWKGSMSVTFDNNGLIEETIYFPDSTNPSYKKWLEPALIWLKKNMPDDLNEVYQNNKLVKNEMTANKWVYLLKKWKADKNNIQQ